jgi:beta-glucanase (GH16 family)
MLTINILNDGGTYTSTRITTKDKVEFTYGRIEARAKIPTGTGVWPAIWMLGANIDDVGWPRCGEIDILEYVGKNPGEVFNSVHTLASSGNTINTETTSIPDIEEGFHVFAANWTSNRIEFFVDDILLYTYFPPTFTEEHWPFNKDAYLILNTAVGGNFGGPDIDDSIFPQQFIIDYIRVYSN